MSLNLKAVFKFYAFLDLINIRLIYAVLKTNIYIDQLFCCKIFSLESCTV